MERVYDIHKDAAVLDDFVYGKCCRKGDIKYLNLPAAFDIETTNVIPDKKTGQRPFAFMYHWQFCIGDPAKKFAVFFGRTWADFRDLLDELETRLILGVRRLVVGVHNLAFEWQFIRRFANWSDVFLKGNRQPLRALANGCIEFRDTYALSNMSLGKWCENTPGVVYTKNDGEAFDYHKIRYPWTELTAEEKSYCFCDAASVCECLAYLMKEDNLAKMPMTSTGYVRRDFRQEYKKDEHNRRNFLEYRLTPYTYIYCRKAFRGGNTHANFWKVGELRRNVQSFDISSSYPYVMLTKNFPMSAFNEISPATWKKHYYNNEKWASLLLVVFENIKYVGESGMPYISISRCESVDKCRINDNGRLMRCGPKDIYRKEKNKRGRWVETELLQKDWPAYCSMWITDIDLKIIEREYTYTRRKVVRCYVSRYGQLPEAHKKQVMHYFTLKTELKNVEGKEYEYMKSKNRLNAGFGMMSTDIAKEDWTYEQGEYKHTLFNTDADRIAYLQDKLDKYYKSHNNFLRYEWGVWVCAWARLRLEEMIWKVGKDVLYIDTDSIKCSGDHRKDFEAVNAPIIEAAEASGYYADDPHGVRHYPGVWEYEGVYEEFKTLGAKRYIVKFPGKPGYKTTIAGVAKKAGERYFTEHGIDAFQDGCVIDNAGHVVAYYNDDEIHEIEINGRKIETASNVALADENYTLGITGEYADVLRKAVDNIMIFGL